MSTGNKLILVAEDYQDTRDLYGLFLSRAGFQVALAGDGLEAVRKACELQPDLIIMDLSMPGIDGAEANSRLKADERTSGIPVVLLTAYKLDHLAREIAEAGFAGFLMKPCMPNELVAEIHRVFKTASGEQRSGRIQQAGRGKRHNGLGPVVPPNENDVVE